MEYECSLAAGFFNGSAESTDGPTDGHADASNSTGMFYCRTGPKYQGEDEGKIYFGSTIYFNSSCIHRCLWGC